MVMSAGSLIGNNNGIVLVIASLQMKDTLQRYCLVSQSKMELYVRQYRSVGAQYVCIVNPINE